MNGLIFGVISPYGLIIVAAIFAGVLILKRDEKRLSLPQFLAEDIALWCVPFGIVGARIYYVAFTWSRYAADPITALYIWQGGLAIYGGVLGGALGAFLLARRRRIPFYVVLDLLAPVVLMGQAIGRWGNFFNGEAYGYPITNAAFQFFPAGVYVDGVWHMATFFYESVWNAAGAVYLYRTRLKPGQPGRLFYGYLLVYGAGRMVIEGLRTDSLMLGSLRVSQVLSVLMCLAAVLVFWHRMRARRTALAGIAAALVCVALAALPSVALLGRTLCMAGAALSFLLTGFMLIRKKNTGSQES